MYIPYIIDKEHVGLFFIRIRTLNPIVLRF